MRAVRRERAQQVFSVDGVLFGGFQSARVVIVALHLAIRRQTPLIVSPKRCMWLRTSL